MMIHGMGWSIRIFLGGWFKDLWENPMRIFFGGLIKDLWDAMEIDIRSTSWTHMETDGPRASNS